MLNGGRVGAGVLTMLTCDMAHEASASDPATDRPPQSYPHAPSLCFFKSNGLAQDIPLRRTYLDHFASSCHETIDCKAAKHAV